MSHARNEGPGGCVPWEDHEAAVGVIAKFGIRVVPPEPHHKGPRIRVNGDVVNERNDDEGFYAIVELREVRDA